MSDPAETRNVSHCEKLIMLIRYIYTKYENGESVESIHGVMWRDIDRLTSMCDVLPAEYDAMLQEISNSFRP